MSVFNDIKLKGIDANGTEKEFNLADFDKSAVLYFYPKDNTPYCTKEACDFRDNFNRLTGLVTVIGVSSDDIESHKKFQKDHNLNFILISDPEHKLAQMLGVAKEDSEHGKIGVERSTFIIKDGLISRAWRNVKVDGHVDEVIKSLSS